GGGRGGALGAVCPEGELVDRGRAERVRGRQDHVLALAHRAGGELADGRGLAGAVAANDEHDGRAAGRRRTWSPVRVALDEERRELRADRGLRATGIATGAGTGHEVEGQGGADRAREARALHSG